jgi:nicotinate-nucleotide adenylyltransferase
MKIGVYGGSFDPVHLGHLLMAREAAEAAGLDSVLFMPTHIQPFKQDAEVSADADRIAMLKAATRGNPLFTVSEVETDRKGVSYTIDSLDEIRAASAGEGEGAGAELYFILGTDMFLMLEQWYRAEDLLQSYAFIALYRPGYKDEALRSAAEKYRGKYGTKVIIAENTRFDVSSTMIRKRIQAGKSIAYLVPEEVDTFIREDGLYK